VLNDEPPPRLRLRVTAVEMFPRPKECAGNDDTDADAVDVAAGVPLLFLFALSNSLLFLAEALNIVEILASGHPIEEENWSSIAAHR
jgi:hypothetical protein